MASLPPVQRAFFSSLRYFSFYAPLLAWEARMAARLYSITVDAEVLETLLGLEQELDRVLDAQASRFNTLMSRLEGIDALYAWVLSRGAHPEDAAAMRTLLGEMEAFDRAVVPRLGQIDAEIAGLDALLGQIEDNLIALLGGDR